MNIEVTSAAVSRRVAHLGAVKSDLKITDTSEDTDLLKAIDIVSGEFVKVLGREPWAQSYLVTMPGDGGTFLRSPVWPLVSVSLMRTGGEDNWSTVTASEYSILKAAVRQDQIFRKLGWPRAPYRDPTRTSADARALNVEETCAAGWATPIDKWVKSTEVRLGEYARQSTQLPNNATAEIRHECTTAGTTDASEPTWATTAGDTTTESGGVVWTARSAIEMPANLWAAAMWSVKRIFKQPDLLSAQPPGVQKMSGGGMSIEWGSSGGSAAAASILPTVAFRQAEHYA